jgi:hypothetical protein
VQMACAHAEPTTRLSGDPGKQHRRIVGIQPVERVSQALVIEVLGVDFCSQEMLHRLGGEELRHEIQPPIGKAQAIEDHRHGGRADADPLVQMLVARVQVLRQSHGRSPRRSPDDPVVQSRAPRFPRFPLTPWWLLLLRHHSLRHCWASVQALTRTTPPADALDQ